MAGVTGRAGLDGEVGGALVGLEVRERLTLRTRAATQEAVVEMWERMLDGVVGDGGVAGLVGRRTCGRWSMRGGGEGRDGNGLASYRLARVRGLMGGLRRVGLSGPDMV